MSAAVSAYDGDVTASPEITEAALALSADERAALARELLTSLEPAGDHVRVEAAWAEEIDTRARSVLSGDSSGFAWSQVRSELLRGSMHEDP